ncbi:MAG: bifunctional phosphopantothenoylcysteine decarboxylase/phosphopantothenate--cysteine ligase CoaBC [Muribaculaceae bacterium]|nr:bifunctional phosphopantothenoylcysteine decarboxylase/phosphopantothenate--cysteine ligase CoaBC [Muribaculaceae bacterium]
MLNGKHIILGISGGIAAYKSVALLRLLVKAGAEVQVIITPSGKEFITPVTLSALSGKPVISEFFTANTGSWNSHVDLGLWADAMIIAPATASTIAKMAHGIADNMLITTYLSAKAPVFVAPSMDLDMFAHHTTTNNIALLKSYGNFIIEPAEGELASHLIGKGRMEEPENIVAYLDTYFRSSQDLKGKRVLITAGPTYEKIDPVRFIGNYSSGKMGYSLAHECAARGAKVTLISGPVSLKVEDTDGIEVIKIESGREMLSECEARFGKMDIAIMCAAVADYYVADVADKKIKRESEEIPELKLAKNKDIAATLGQVKTDKQILIGFALETDNEEENALKKLKKKNLDFIVLNSLKDKNSGFGTDNNTITIINKDCSKIKYPNMPKPAVSKAIVDIIVNNYLCSE